MKQQINLYRGGLRREQPAFSALAMAASVTLCVLVLAGAWHLARAHARAMDIELKAMQKHEAAASARLAELTRALAARQGSDGAADTLQTVLDALTRRERLLALIDGQGFGDTAGFSRPLQALARHNVGGLWLTRILVSAPAMRTTLEGRATSPGLVPEYLLGLSAQGAMSGQRFDRFEIEQSDESEGPSVRFSMTSTAAEQFAQRGSP